MEKNTTLDMQPKFDEKKIRELNQYLYDNSINLSKSQKTLFIASVLICLKINENILNDFNDSCDSYLIADKMLEIINGYYSDSLFTNNFSFIKKSIHNKHLYHIFNTIKVDIKQYGKDILNQFYSEFCIWDRNNDGKLGIVLTPDDIVDLMVNESFKCYCEVNNELVLIENVEHAENYDWKFKYGPSGRLVANLDLKLMKQSKFTDEIETRINYE